MWLPPPYSIVPGFIMAVQTIFLLGINEKTASNIMVWERVLKRGSMISKSKTYVIVVYL